MSNFYDEPLCGSVTLDNLGTSAWMKYKGASDFRKFWWGHAGVTAKGGLFLESAICFFIALEK